MRWSIEYSDGSDFMSQYAIGESSPLIMEKLQEKSSFFEKIVLQKVYIFVYFVYFLYTPMILYESVPAGLPFTPETG